MFGSLVLPGEHLHLPQVGPVMRQVHLILLHLREGGCELFQGCQSVAKTHEGLLHMPLLQLRVTQVAPYAGQDGVQVMHLRVLRDETLQEAACPVVIFLRLRVPLHHLLQNSQVQPDAGQRVLVFSDAGKGLGQPFVDANTLHVAVFRFRVPPQVSVKSPLVVQERGQETLVPRVVRMITGKPFKPAARLLIVPLGLGRPHLDLAV